MRKLLIEGGDLTTVKNVVNAMGNYHITEITSDFDKIKLIDKPIIPNTCSSCPYFTDLIDRPEQWGRCAKFGDSAINRNKGFCKAYKEEVNYTKVRF